MEKLIGLLLGFIFGSSCYFANIYVKKNKDKE